MMMKVRKMKALCVCVLQTLVCAWSESLEMLEETILCPRSGDNIIDWFYKVTESVNNQIFCQVSQYTFAMCSYRQKKAEPQELMQMEGYTVDYCNPQTGTETLRHTQTKTHTYTETHRILKGITVVLTSLPGPPPLSGLKGGRVFFNAVREGDLVMFACDDEQDRMMWVQAMYRATGQSYKPVPPLQNRTSNRSGGSLNPAPPMSMFTFILWEAAGVYSLVESGTVSNVLREKRSWFIKR